MEDVAAYYGNLARVAIGFYLQTGNAAELNAAYWYTRYAVNAARGTSPARY